MSILGGSVQEVHKPPSEEHGLCVIRTSDNLACPVHALLNHIVALNIFGLYFYTWNTRSQESSRGAQRQGQTGPCQHSRCFKLLDLWLPVAAGTANRCVLTVPNGEAVEQGQAVKPVVVSGLPHCVHSRPIPQ